MKTVSSFNGLKLTYQTSRCHKSEVHSLKLHRRENLKYFKLIQRYLNSQDSRSTEILRLIYINIALVEVIFAPPSNFLVFRTVLRICADNVHWFV
jgi:hypothetical protein